jgi:hypothetical protein
LGVEDVLAVVRFGDGWVTGFKTEHVAPDEAVFYLFFIYLFCGKIHMAKERA